MIRGDKIAFDDDDDDDDDDDGGGDDEADLEEAAESDGCCWLMTCIRSRWRVYVSKAIQVVVINVGKAQEIK